MRNRALHDALRNFALEAAALLTDDLRAGAEVEFDVVNEGGPRGPALYHYQPRIHAFIGERWERLRDLPGCEAACGELGAGASTWLRMNGLRGEQAEPALRAMLERLYEDATSFGFPEERFERVYEEVERTLYRDAVHARVVAPLAGAWIDAERLDLGGGLSLVRGERAEAPQEAVLPEDGDGEPGVLCVLERDVAPGETISAAEAYERFGKLVTALRLWAPGQVGVGAPGWRSSGGGRWEAIPLGAAGARPPRAWQLPEGEERGLRDFFRVVEEAEPPRVVAWALARFEMGCERRLDSEALPDFLLALRALLDATSDAGEASLALRVAALCAEEGNRRGVQRRVEAALALERHVMGSSIQRERTGDSPAELVAEVEGHLRALLRDVLCGYLDADLKSVADDILLESSAEPFVGEITARDLRRERPRLEREPEGPPEPSAEQAWENEVYPEPSVEEPEPRPEPEPSRQSEPERSRPEPAAREPDPDTAELEPVMRETSPPVQAELEGVTPSADWGWDDPEDYSAPV
jgi:hypothetical protein